jgi:alpha-amylase
MKYKVYLLLLFIQWQSCKKDSGKVPDWSKDLRIYEITPKQYSEKRNIEGITEDLDRISTMFFNGICLLPVQERDEANNAFNPASPFAIKSFEELDPSLGNTEQLNQLIESAHKKGIKVLIEWNFTTTGPHHIWRANHPEYYLSSEKMIGNHYNQDYVKLNITNELLQKELIVSIKSFLRKNHFDGVVFYDLDKMPEAFIQKLVNTLNSIRPMLLINHSKTFVSQCHYNMNNNLYSLFQQAYNGELTVSRFNSMLDTTCKYPVVNYLQDYLMNDRYGSDATAFYNAYKYYHSLSYFLPGIPWVLNGQEDPQFETINLFSSKPFLRKYKYNYDFYRSLNLLMQSNPALWNNNPENLPKKISDSDEVLALERTSGNSTCIGFFNLTNHVVSYTVQKDYSGYYDAFNKVPVNIKKEIEQKLGPYQSLIFSNKP